MIWFIGGALLSFVAFAWAGAGKHWRIWLAGFLPFCLVAFSFENAGRPFVIVLGFVILGTAARSLAAHRKGLVWIMSPTALSDVLVALAFTAHYSATFDWNLPANGQWKAGAVLLGLASVARGATAVIANESGTIALSSLSLWEAAFLAWWAGPSAGALLLFFAVLLAVVAWRLPNRAAPILGVAATLGAASLGVGVLSVNGIAAGSALMLGERVFSLWTLGLLPLSILTRHLGDFHPWFLVAMLILPIVWLPAINAGTRRSYAGRTGRIIGIASALVTVPALAALDFYWLVYAAGLAGFFAWRLLESSPIPLREFGSERLSDARWSWMGAAAWSLVAFSIVLLARLIVIGQGTSFI